MDHLFTPGTLCGGYRIRGLIGAGAQAEVYEAEGPKGALFAIKLVPVVHGQAEVVQERLLEEGVALASVDHPNVVRYFGSGVHGDHIYLVLERVFGTPLSTRIHPEEVFPLEDAVRWMLQVCDGVAAIHRRGIVHRDLKPSNVLITPDECAKVIDFGLAKIPHSAVATALEHQVGSALYMSPEQVRHEQANPLMDVYAMGLVIYETVSGVHPIGNRARSMFDICQWQLVQRPRPLREVAPEAPGDLEELVACALEKDPGRRPTMAAMARGLEDALSRLRAPLRRVARNVPLPGRPAVLAPTTPMAAMSEPPASAPRSAAPAAPPAASARAAVEVSSTLHAAGGRSSPGAERTPVLPSAPSAPASAPVMVSRGSLSAPSSSASTERSSAPLLVERRTTGVPISATLPELPRSGRRTGPLVALAAALLAAGGIGAWWTTRASMVPASAAAGGGASAPLPSASAPAVVSASARAAPAISSAPASAPASAGRPLSTTSARRPAAAPPAQPGPRRPAPAPHRVFDAEQ